MSQLQVNRINDASGGVLAPISSVMRNRVINGAMVIDQRNASARGIRPAPLSYVIAKRRNAGIEQAWVIQDLQQWLEENMNKMLR